MKYSTLTTKLNIRIIGVVLLLMITTSTYNHWLSWQEENEKNIKFLISITNYLANKVPANFFTDFSRQEDITMLPTQDQALAMNQTLQPLLSDLFVPLDTIKFGFYSRYHQHIVAIGPTFDNSLLVTINPDRSNAIYEGHEEPLFEKKNSLIWYGANTISYIKPIEEQGVIVGHAFATINQDAISKMIWKRTLNTFLGAFLMLLVCIIIFRELFVKLKKDLQGFAKAIHSGQSYTFASEVTEFTPLLKHISAETDKMTRLDRLNIIGEMAAGIAHEIRNPMTTVRGFLQFMSTKKEFATQKERFSIMISELDRGNSILTEFLALAKDRAMVFKEQNLNSIVHDIFPLLQADALCNNCEITLALQAIPNVSVDENSIRQFIFNMVRNGLDAMPMRGNITISTKVENEKVSLSIKDSGTGIPLEIKDKLGTPFFTTKEQGTGLGLAICYRIVQLHAATLTFESEIGKGTTFTVEFSGIPKTLPRDCKE